jgi:hypothetical protein
VPVYLFLCVSVSASASASSTPLFFLLMPHACVSASLPLPCKACQIAQGKSMTLRARAATAGKSPLSCAILVRARLKCSVETLQLMRALPCVENGEGHFVAERCAPGTLPQRAWASAARRDTARGMSAAHLISRDVRAVSNVRESPMAVQPSESMSLWLRWRIMMGRDGWRGWQDGVAGRGED